MVCIRALGLHVLHCSFVDVFAHVFDYFLPKVHACTCMSIWCCLSELTCARQSCACSSKLLLPCDCLFFTLSLTLLYFAPPPFLFSWLYVLQLRCLFFLCVYIRHLNSTATKLEWWLRRPCFFNGMHAFISCSIGGLQFPKDCCCEY